MEGAEPDTLGDSLLQWVKSFEDPSKIRSWKDLSDGNGLWHVLQEVDAEYFAGSLPEPGVGPNGDWTRKWQNIKHLEKHLSTYYRDVCNGQDNVGTTSMPDLKAIAADASTKELEKLIMVIIRASMASPESNQRMAQRLMSLGRERAMIIANELRNMEEPEDTESEPVSRDESAYQSEQETKEEPKHSGLKNGSASFRDPLLEREEELLQAQVTIDKLQASQAAAQLQLQELRQDKEKLQEAFDAYRADIDTKGRRHGGEDSFKKLQRQAENDRAYIDDLENQMQSSRNTMESFERQLERHKADQEASQKLRDDLQMLRAENEDLNQKVRANENLRKKIQTLQEQEKMNSSLREELKEANDRLDELDRLKHVQAGLEKEIIEKKGLIRNQEYQINELTMTRKHAEYEAKALAQKLEGARDRHERDHDALEELRLKLQDTGVGDADIEENPQEQQRRPSDEEARKDSTTTKTDESKHLAEKLAMVEKQLEAADARLKQAAERNAAFEEQSRAREAPTPPAVPVTPEVKPEEAVPQDLAALRRENHLMATAWYDLSSRLQNNGVSLGRRRPEPRSWIGKQRALVGPASSLQQQQQR